MGEAPTRRPADGHADPDDDVRKSALSLARQFDEGGLDFNVSLELMRAFFRSRRPQPDATSSGD